MLSPEKLFETFTPCFLSRVIEILRNVLPLLFFQNLENQRDKEREDRRKGGGEEKKGSGEEGEKQRKTGRNRERDLGG